MDDYIMPHATDVEECRNNRLCQCIPGGASCEEPSGLALTAQMHFTGHILPGMRDFTTNLPDEMKDTIEDVAASPNDPFFIVHHAMVDCILDELLKRHSDAEYPTDPLVKDGHRRDDYFRGFFPLFTNGDLFKRTEEFGYSCILSNLTDPEPENRAATVVVMTWPLLFLLTSIITVTVVMI